MSERAGEINVYVCEKCGWKAITRNRDDGVTPMFIRCEGEHCDKETFPGAHSLMYQVDQTLEPTHEWYWPRTAGERKKVTTQAMWSHVNQGGLLLRKLVPVVH